MSQSLEKPMNTQSIPLEPRGRTRLWVAFWIYGVLVSHLFFGAILYFYREISTPMLAVLFLAFLLYTAWIMRTIWVNAYNAENEVWTHLARWLTVAWALNAVLISAFLFLSRWGNVPLPF